MLQTLKSRRNRKGFTLAELLIVVAIIAVLVAIAVPLFVGALNDAEDRVGEANCRAVRGLAVEEILMNWETYKTGTTTTAGSGPEEPGTTTKGTAVEWYAHAEVGASGEVESITVVASSTANTMPTIEGNTLTIASGSSSAYKKIDGGGYEVLVKITELK